MLSVPYEAQHGTAEQIIAGSQGKTVITVVVPLKPPKVATVWRPAAGSAAEELQAQLGPEAIVVAAFQNIAAGHLKDLNWQADCDVLYTGDSKEAKAVTREIHCCRRLLRRGRRPAGQLVRRRRADRHVDRRQRAQ
ncbi:MAG: hypothetical protein V9G19_11460 [Tetrasphaera sp.]